MSADDDGIGFFRALWVALVFGVAIWAGIFLVIWKVFG